MAVIGYVPGVYDMFHIGHLNLLRHARDKCDVLIAGVVTDDYVRRVKGNDPVVPHDERRQIVAAIGYVDQVVEDDSTDKTQVWRQHRFDVLFKGDDWKGTAKGARLEESMAGLGVEVVYFPYTISTSSTLLRSFLSARVNSGAG